jgi:hypothetical protein
MTRKPQVTRENELFARIAELEQQLKQMAGRACYLWHDWHDRAPDETCPAGDLCENPGR